MYLAIHGPDALMMTIARGSSRGMIGHTRSFRPEPIAMENTKGDGFAGSAGSDSAGPVAVVQRRSESCLVHGTPVRLNVAENGKV